MKIENDEKFIRNVERMIDPSEICNLKFYQRFTKFIPRFIFKKVLADLSKKYTKIGFVIEPYSLFLFYKLKDIEKAKAMLPDRYELVKAKIFDDDTPEYLWGTGIFNARATTFWGARQESYLIAKDKETGIISWIFIDVLSNTIIAMPSHGLMDPNSKDAIFTTNSKGEIFVDFKEDKTDRHIVAKAKITNAKPRALFQDIWLLGNTSVGHSKKLSGGHDDPFAVIFDPAEIETALDVPLTDVEVSKNNLFPDLIEKELCKVLCFPFAQHYIADSPGCRTRVNNYDEMIKIYKELENKTEMKTISPKIIEKQLVISIILMVIALIVFHVMI